MSIMERIKETAGRIHFSSNDLFTKDELLPAMLELQKEFASAAMGNGQPLEYNPRIWETITSMKKRSITLGGVAANELIRLEMGATDMSNCIKAEISGRRGEEIAFGALKRLRNRNHIIRNMEIHTSDGDSEIDLTVITEKGVFLIEVKNSRKNAFISEDGNYYKIGEFMRLDSALGTKMRMRSEFIKNAAAKGGFEDVPVYEIVVFTNDHIEVQNLYQGFSVCFPSQLAYFIDSKHSDAVLSEEDIDNLYGVLNTVKSANESRKTFDFNVDSLVHDFALAQAMLEEAEDEARDSSTSPAKQILTQTQIGCFKQLKYSIMNKPEKTAAMFAV